MKSICNQEHFRESPFMMSHLNQKEPISVNFKQHVIETTSFVEIPADIQYTVRVGNLGHFDDSFSLIFYSFSHQLM
jgi:hypothetical protein